MLRTCSFLTVAVLSLMTSPAFAAGKADPAKILEKAEVIRNPQTDYTVEVGLKEKGKDLEGKKKEAFEAKLKLIETKLQTTMKMCQNNIEKYTKLDAKKYNDHIGAIYARLGNMEKTVEHLKDTKYPRYQQLYKKAKAELEKRNK